MLKVIFTATILAAWLYAGVATANTPETRDPNEFFFTQTFGDLPEEAQIARDEGKLGMLLFFESENCSYCKLMRREVFSQKNVQDWYGKRFVSIAVDIHGNVELSDFDGITLPSRIFSEQRQVFLTPVLSFIDLNGSELYRHLGMIKTAEEILLLGEYIAGEHYYDTEYQTFSAARGMQRDGDTLATRAADSGRKKNNGD